MTGFWGSAKRALCRTGFVGLVADRVALSPRFEEHAESARRCLARQQCLFPKFKKLLEFALDWQQRPG